MAASKTKQQIEFEPDAWQRFKRAVKVVAKTSPQHRVGSKAKRQKPKRQRKTPAKKSGRLS